MVLGGERYDYGVYANLSLTKSLTGVQSLSRECGLSYCSLSA